MLPQIQERQRQRARGEGPKREALAAKHEERRPRREDVERGKERKERITDTIADFRHQHALQEHPEAQDQFEEGVVSRTE